MKVLSLAVLFIPSAMGQGLRAPDASSSTAQRLQRSLVPTCPPGNMTQPKWAGTNYTTCTNYLAAAVGSLTSGDNTSTGLSDFCVKCGKEYDTRAADWRANCSASVTKDAWKDGPTQNIKAISQGLDAFGCSKTKDGSFCAALYAASLKSKDPLCTFYGSCCFGTLKAFQKLDAASLATINKACPGSVDAFKTGC